MDELMTGALAMAFVVAGLFFVRFWRTTHDRLFAIFALSFFLMAVNRIGLVMASNDLRGDRLYWVRFLAFVLILVAVVDKNRPPRSSPADG